MASQIEVVHCNMRVSERERERAVTSYEFDQDQQHPTHWVRGMGTAEKGAESWSLSSKLMCGSDVST